MDSAGKTENQSLLPGRTLVLNSVSTLNFNLTHFNLSVTFESFDLRRLVERMYGNKAPLPKTRVPASVTEWLDELPRIAVDANGLPIVLHIPQWQKEKSLVCRWMRTCPLRDPELTFTRISLTIYVTDWLKYFLPLLGMGRIENLEIPKVVIVGQKGNCPAR